MAIDGELSDRTAVISGASQGLGKEIARAYLTAGANVVLCARSDLALAATADELRQIGGASNRVVSLVADVARVADVRRVVSTALGKFGQVNILVNNAGIHGPKGVIDEVEWQAWVDAININLLGSVCFIREILPYFKEKRYGKIIQVSGGGATKPMQGMSPYGASKAAVVRFAETLALEVCEYNIDVNSLAPGTLNTRLLDDVLQAGAEKIGSEAYAQAVRQRSEGGTPFDVPARLAVFLASARSDGITGKLISAVWDDWESFPEHLEELNNSDVYTLRRIVAKDRGFDWGGK